MDTIRFVFPIDGDCVSGQDGEMHGDLLYLPVRVGAPEAHLIFIDGKSAE